MADTATASSITTIKANKGLVLAERRASSVRRGCPSSGRGPRSAPTPMQCSWTCSAWTSRKSTEYGRRVQS